MGLSVDQNDTAVCPMRIPSHYLDHPGGQNNLDIARKNTRPDLLFLSYHVGQDFDKIALKCKEKGVTMPARGPLYDELHAAVKEVIRQHPEQRYIYMGWCLLTTAILPYSYVQWLLDMTLFSSLFFLFWLITYAFNIFHMRHHKGNLYHHKILNCITEPFYDFIDNTFMVAPSSWQISHNGSHHVFTNHDELDPDVDSKSTLFLIRMLPTQLWLWFHRYEWLYTPFVFSLSTLFFPVANISFRGGTWFHFVSWIVLILVNPTLINGWSGLKIAIGVYMFSGIIMAYLFSVSHNNPNLVPTNITPASIDGWIKHQLSESVSWGGYVSSLMFGGINLQVEHHLFPALDSTIYPFLVAPLRQIFQKHDLNYLYEPTFFHAAWQYHKWLYLMGRCPTEGKLPGINFGIK